MADEDPKSSEKFGGGEFGLDSGGSFEVDTTGALVGEVQFVMANDRALTVKIGDDPVFVVTRGADGKVHINLGTGANERLVLGDSFMAFFNQFVGLYNGHTHECTAPGTPSLKPAAPAATMGADLLSAAVKAQK